MSTRITLPAGRPRWIRRSPSAAGPFLPALRGGTLEELQGEMETAARGAQQYVRWVQQALNKVLGLRLAITGVADAATRAAIRTFQQRKGLTVDGMVGPQTEGALLAADAPPLPWAATAGGAGLGADDVRWVQHALNQLLGARLQTDGIMGPQTQQALRAFQQKQGLAPTGSLDTQTSSRLVSGLGGAPQADPCAGLKPAEVLDGFDFDQQWVKPAHQPRIIQIARCILASRRTSSPITTVRVVGHTDNEGTGPYNEQLGMRRASETVRHLKATLERISPGGSAGVSITPDSRGEREPVSATAPAHNRRVQIFLPLKPPVPVIPLTVHQVKVVAKSFIARIGSRVGAPTCSLILPMPLPLPPPLPTTATVRLQALAAATDGAFSENPLTDRQDKTYRLFSECTFTVTCRGGTLVSAVPSALATDAGTECIPRVGVCLQPPPLVTVTPVSVRPAGAGTVTFTWLVRGRPHPLAEPAFQLVCPRTSMFIWHLVEGTIECTTGSPRVRVRVVGSQFPSHRVFVNGAIGSTVPQGEFRNLWIPSASDPAVVA